MVVCAHRDRARQERRAEVAREYKHSGTPLGAVLQDLLMRADRGEFVGQDDGDVFRSEDISHHFSASPEEVEAAAKEAGLNVVVGVVFPG